MRKDNLKNKSWERMNKEMMIKAREKEKRRIEEEKIFRQKLENQEIIKDQIKEIEEKINQAEKGKEFKKEVKTENPVNKKQIVKDFWKYKPEEKKDYRKNFIASSQENKKPLEKEVKQKIETEIKPEKEFLRPEKKEQKEELQEKKEKPEEKEIIEINVSEKPKKKGKLPAAKKSLLFCLIISLLFGIGVFLYTKKILASLISTALAFLLILAYFISLERLKKYQDIKKMEDAFPDFIGLMSSNLRAGMTVDQALLLSSRKEFAPLDKEIFRLGKDIVTGKEIVQAMNEMSMRINSEKIKKTIKLITSGIKTGGNLAILLEQTSENIKERTFVEKRAASNVLMYVIFIFFAVAVGAPMLFALSSVLVEILVKILSNLPTDQINTGLPFTLTEINVSTKFILYFALTFVFVSDILSSFVLGLVNKGKEREGLKFILPLIIISVTVFFIARIVLLRYLADFFK